MIFFLIRYCSFPVSILDYLLTVVRFVNTNVFQTISCISPSTYAESGSCFSLLDLPTGTGLSSLSMGFLGIAYDPSSYSSSSIFLKRTICGRQK